jgi:hypothetical protein
MDRDGALVGIIVAGFFVALVAVFLLAYFANCTPLNAPDLQIKKPRL